MKILDQAIVSRITVIREKRLETEKNNKSVENLCVEVTVIEDENTNDI